MKLKKYSYLLAFILMLVIGINEVDAKVNKSCYYVSSDLKAKAKLQIKNGEGELFVGVEKEHSLVHVNQIGKKIDNDDEPVLNWYDTVDVRGSNLKINKINSSKSAAAKSKTCPKYLVIVYETDWFNEYDVYATNSETEAKKIAETLSKKKNWTSFYASNTDKNGKEITKNDYYNSFTTIENIYDENAWCEPDPVTGEVDENCYQIMCDNLFGDKNDDGTPKDGAKDKQYDLNKDGTASIAYLVESVLAYVRVIVPILIIVLGLIDLAKAVIASKEDEMRKAQATFIKRLILGVVVFFVPLIIEVLMQLADLVWESSGYSSCQLR